MMYGHKYYTSTCVKCVASLKLIETLLQVTFHFCGLLKCILHDVLKAQF
jgi:hypothetical protein